MWRIRKDQVAHFNTEIQSRRVERLTQAIRKKIASVDSSAGRHLPEDQVLLGIRETVRAALHYEIADFESQCRWSYIWLATGHKFWEDQNFRYFLDDPLFHPKSKARNIVAGFRVAALIAAKAG